MLRVLLVVYSMSADISTMPMGKREDYEGSAVSSLSAQAGAAPGRWSTVGNRQLSNNGQILWSITSEHFILNIRGVPMCAMTAANSSENIC